MPSGRGALADAAWPLTTAAMSSLQSEVSQGAAHFLHGHAGLLALGPSSGCLQLPASSWTPVCSVLPANPPLQVPKCRLLSPPALLLSICMLYLSSCLNMGLQGLIGIFACCSYLKAIPSFAALLWASGTTRETCKCLKLAVHQPGKCPAAQSAPYRPQVPST